MPNDFRGPHIWQYRAVQDMFWIGAGVALIYFGYWMRSVFTPLLLALALAYVVHPLIAAARARVGIPRYVTTASVIAAAVSIAIICIWTVLPQAIAEGEQLIDELPELAQKIDTWLGHVSPAGEQMSFASLAHRLSPSATAEELTPERAAAGVDAIASVVGNVLYIGLWLVLFPVFFFIFAWRFEETLQSGIRFVPSGYREEVSRIATKLDEVIGGYVRGRLVAVAFLCVGFSLGWWLAGVPYWLLLGVTTGMLGAAPWLAALGWPMAILLKLAEVESLATGSDWVSVVVWPTAVYLIVQALENYAITPWVQSQAMEMSPTMIMIVILLGGSVGGAYGLLLAIPAAGCLKVVASEYLVPRLEAWAGDTQRSA